MSAERAGVSAHGQTIERVVHPALGLMPGLLWIEEDGKVSRVVSLHTSIEESP